MSSTRLDQARADTQEKQLTYLSQQQYPTSETSLKDSKKAYKTALKAWEDLIAVGGSLPLIDEHKKSVEAVKLIDRYSSPQQINLYQNLNAAKTKAQKHHGVLGQLQKLNLTSDSSFTDTVTKYLEALNDWKKLIAIEEENILTLESKAVEAGKDVNKLQVICDMGTLNWKLLSEHRESSEALEKDGKRFLPQSYWSGFVDTLFSYVAKATEPAKPANTYDVSISKKNR